MECKTQKEGHELYVLSCGRNHEGEEPYRKCTEWTSKITLIQCVAGIFPIHFSVERYGNEKLT